MVTIHNDTFIPYEFATVGAAFKYIIERAHHIKKSIRFVELKNGHLYLRCPISSDYLEVVGDMDDLTWIHDKLIQNNWYRVT